MIARLAVGVYIYIRPQSSTAMKQFRAGQVCSMEPSAVSQSQSIVEGGTYPSTSFLGYFLKIWSKWFHNGLPFQNRRIPRSLDIARFTCTSNLGKELKEGAWGNLDETLSFLDKQTVDIVGSSNGLLLCFAANHVDFHQMAHMDYTVCNPVTREFRSLPRPHKAYRYVAVAFICKGSNATPLDGVEYEVIRAGMQHPSELTRTLEIDTFSSITNRWTAASLESSSPFALLVCNKPAVVVGEVIYWCGWSSTLLAYDRAMETVQLIELPRASPSPTDYLLGQCEGQLQHGRVDLFGLEIWVLEDYRRSAWILKHRVSFTEVNRSGCSPCWATPLRLHGFHPNKSELLFITWSGHPFWIDFKDYTLTEAGGGLIPDQYQIQFFPYEWPLARSDGQ